MASTFPAAEEVSSESSPELMLLKRNIELEEELKQSQQREVLLRVKLQQAEERLTAVEEAEERLSSHLGDLEAERVAEMMGYKARIMELTEELLQVTDIVLNPIFPSSSALAAAISFDGAGNSAAAAGSSDGPGDATAGADKDHDRQETDV